MKIPESKYFHLEEFFSKETWDRFGEHCIRFVRPEILVLSNKLREHFGKPCTINDWMYSQTPNYNYSGFREHKCKIGAQYSMHKYFAAIDIKVKGLTSEEIQEDVIKNYDKIYKEMGLTAMETDTSGWTHFSTQWTRIDNLFLIPNPNKK